MPSCSNCSKVQAKLCKGALCKPCLNKKINGDSMAINIDVGDSLSSNRLVIDMIKENMTQERQWNAEIISHLKDSIEHLKNEAHSKNALIKELIIELRNVRSSCSSTLDNTLMDSQTSLDNYNTLDNYDICNNYDNIGSSHFTNFLEPQCSVAIN